MQDEKDQQTHAILRRYVPAPYLLPCESITGGAKHRESRVRPGWMGKDAIGRVKWLRPITKRTPYHGTAHLADF